ncbi:MAG: serine hydrolase domain-containing protein [Phycisphaerales bacterium]
MDSLLAEYASDSAPGLAVMVIRDGEVLHANGYGVADMESGRPITPETPFRLASVSKQMVAFVTVMLEERGLLDFDDPVATWVPEVARFEGVTVRHLLNHTSGLPDYYDFASLGAAADSAYSPESSDDSGLFANAEAAAFYETEGEFEFEPGTRFAYSNPGYELLALITERITGEPFADFIDRELFDPIGMETAQVRAYPSTVIPGRAIGYSADSTGTWTENDDHPFNWMIGAGGIYASLKDMYRWDQALWRWADEGDRLEASFTPPELPGDSVSTYGFGWGIEEDPPRVMHSGGWVGFITYIVRYLDDRLTVVVLSNASLESPDIAAQVAELYMGG